MRRLAILLFALTLVACIGPASKTAQESPAPSNSGALGSQSHMPSVSSSPSPPTPTSIDNACIVPRDPPSRWPVEAIAAVQALIARYIERCASTPDLELYFSLPDNLSMRQEKEIVRWYSDALQTATRVFGDLLQSTKPIALFYKTSAKSMCTELLSFIREDRASAGVIEDFRASEWACKPSKDWKASYNQRGYSATVLAVRGQEYDYIIVNMGNAEELRTKNPYKTLTPTFQTPSHELFHLVQSANRSQGATLWWGEGAASYVGHLTAAMQGMVTYAEARDRSLVRYSCDAIAMDEKAGPPAISELSGGWEVVDGKWWSDFVYPLGALASEYVLGTYGWDKFQSWANGYESQRSLTYLNERSRRVFGISLAELQAEIDKYLKRVLAC